MEEGRQNRMDLQLFRAASNGDLQFFENLTDPNDSLLQVTTEKNTVLHVALQFKKFEAAEKIVNLIPILVLKRNASGNTPLHVAAMVGASSLVKILIQKAKHQRDVEASDQQPLRTMNKDGDTALHVAVRYDNDNEFEIVKELIKEDQELARHKNNAGESALFLAVDRQQYDMALHILSNAPDCSYAGRHGMNVLHALVIHTSSYGRVFVPDLRVVHMRDLNFVLRSEIFVHNDGQLRASHLILGVQPVYTTWQAFGQALLVDSPLLPYIDVRHPSFLPAKFSVGEARELGPRYICSDERQPLRDESAERVSRARRERAHEQIEQEAAAQPEGQIDQGAPQQNVEEVVAEPEPVQIGETVTRRTMTINRFIPGAGQATEQQQPQGGRRTPPPPPVAWQRKRQKTTEQTVIIPPTATAKTPPRPSSGIVIREPVTQTGTNVASSSRAAPAWQPSYMLDGKLLPSDANVHVWAKGAGGHVAQSLARGLLLSEHVRAFEEGTDESMARRLQWHTIAAAQLACILDRRVSDLAEDAGRERALKDVADVNAKEKAIAAAAAEKKAAAAEKAKAEVENRYAELQGSMGDIELRLAEAESLGTVREKELAEVRAALEASESKWYNEGFADAENSAEPVIRAAQKLGFQEGWMAALQAMGVPEDSPLRNVAQIPFPVSSPIRKATLGPLDEEETTSLRELVEQIDAHAELEETEVASQLRTGDQLVQDPVQTEAPV